MFSPSGYDVVVKTGDHKGAGTASAIHLTMQNSSGTSREVKVGVTWSGDFVKGSTDTFKIDNAGITEDIERIEVRLGGAGIFGQDWFVETIHIKFEDSPHGQVSAFPLHRWLKDGETHCAAKDDSTLPQEETNTKQRATELARKKQIYQLEKKLDGKVAIAQVAELPSEQQFSNSHFFDVIVKRGAIYATASVAALLTTERWDTLDDLTNVYNGPFPVPYGVQNWRGDNEFAGQRLTGCNANQIRLCEAIPANFAVNDAMLQPLMEGMNIKKAIKNKKLFIVNFSVMKDIPTKDGDVVCAPIALFFVGKSKTLMPIAIQLYQDPAPDNPVFLPTDPEYTWLLAKMWFNNADGNYHESVTHLSFTHLIVETMSVAANRCLSPSHPIFKLMAPHWLYVMAINSFALVTLINPGGIIDQITNAGTVGLQELVARVFPNWHLDREGDFLADLRNRGVDDPDVLPGYFYRDDAILLHGAIKRYVKSVVNKRYHSLDLLTGDYEIQEFAATLVKPIDSGGCGIKGVPGNGKLATNSQLIDVLTSIIFISSVGHAAANFNQYDEYGFPPNSPLIMNGVPPKDKTTLTEKAVLDSLPNKQDTLSIMTSTMLLSERATQRLGNFEGLYQTDPVGKEAVKRFQEELASIGETIRSNDASRAPKYPYLDPREVPNAISI